MAKVFQEFEFNFKFNDKDASKSINTISKDLKQMIANFGDASDKISVLKDLVGYLNKVDASLNDLKTNNKDLFNQIFGSVDKNLTGALSELFGVLNSDMTMLDGLKQRVQDANVGLSWTFQKELRKILIAYMKKWAHKSRLILMKCLLEKVLNKLVQTLHLELEF